MMGRQAAIVLGAFLGALGTQGLSAGDDDRAVPRGGGSSGGGGHRSGGSSSGSGSSAGASHHGGGSSSGSSYSGSSERGRSARAPRTEAQRRHPQPGTGTGYRNHRYYGGSRYYGSYYRPYSYWPYDNYYWGYGYFSPWYYPRYSGFYGGGYYGGGYGGYGYGGGYGGGYHRGYYERSGSVRVMVEPNETKVYVDDYYAGVADDFDGLFQRLNLTPGRHDIALNLEGFETHRVKLYVPLDHTIKIKHKMVRGAADRVSESTVGDPADEARYARRADDDDEDDDRPELDGDRDRQTQDRYEPQDRAEDTRRDDSWPANRERGTLRLAVSPADASIYVDGMFRGTGDDLRRLSLPEGRHRLEVVRPGYRTIERDVEVQAGETEEVEVDLPRS